MKHYIFLLLAMSPLFGGPRSWEVFFEKTYNRLHVVQVLTDASFWQEGNANDRAQQLSGKYCQSGLVTNLRVFSGKRDAILLHSMNTLPNATFDEESINTILKLKSRAYASDLLCDGKSVIRAREFNRGKIADFIAKLPNSSLLPLLESSLEAVRISIDQGADGKGDPIIGADLDFYIRPKQPSTRADCERTVRLLSQIFEASTIFLRRDGEFRESGGPEFDIFGPWPQSAADYVTRHKKWYTYEKTVVCIFNSKTKNVTFPNR